ncbi:unnamed protein product [Camellia sinensis]
MAFDLESLSEATSGAIGALVSTTVLYPLDTCKNKYQAEVRSHNRQKYRNIPDVYWEAISNHQVLSLYQGLGTKNLQSIFQFIYFYGYSFFKKLYLKKSGLKSIDTKANLVLAAAAGACAVIVTQPLDTASSRMQTSEFGKSQGLWKTLSEGTWSEAFDALGISLLLTTNPSIQYTVFDQLKQRLQRGQLSKKLGTESSSDSLSAVSAFVLGAVSKCIATCLTYPAIREIIYSVTFRQLNMNRMLDASQVHFTDSELLGKIGICILNKNMKQRYSKKIVVQVSGMRCRCKVMIQAAESEEDRKKEARLRSRKTVSGAIQMIWRREGLLGFFKGLDAQILKTVLSSALLLMVKEKSQKPLGFYCLHSKAICS